MYQNRLTRKNNPPESGARVKFSSVLQFLLRYTVMELYIRPVK